MFNRFFICSKMRILYSDLSDSTIFEQILNRFVKYVYRFYYQHSLSTLKDQDPDSLYPILLNMMKCSHQY